MASMSWNIRRVPKEFLLDLEEVKKEHKLPRDRDAFIKMRDYAIVGREVERMAPFSFIKRMRRK